MVAPQGGRRVLLATGTALLVASVLLVTVVLPAEYAIDPLGTGRLLGLTGLAGESASVLTPVTAAGTHRQDEVEFVLAPFESVEYKFRLAKDAGLLYEWRATAAVSFDFHAEADDAPAGTAQSYRVGRSAAERGTYVAPFSGIHGWFWQNRTTDAVSVRLTAAGFFEQAIEFRDGHRYPRDIPPQ